MFLSKEDLAVLTGRKSRQLQIAQLRKMGIPFFVNAHGDPVVTRASVEGGAPPEKRAWAPALSAR